MFIEDLIDNFGASDKLIRKIAPVGYIIAINARSATPEVFHCTYPEQWWNEYYNGTYRILDPTVHWAVFSNGAKRWSEISTLPSFMGGQYVMDQAKKYGLNYGVTITKKSLAGAGKKSMLAAAREDREFSDEEIAELNDEFLAIAEHIEPKVILLDGEIKSLEACARGMSHKEIASELKVGAMTVNRYLNSARKKLKARNNAQAVLAAKAKGLIKLSAHLDW